VRFATPPDAGLPPFARAGGESRLTVMLTPTVIEISRALEPVARDTFIDAARAAAVKAFPARPSQVRGPAAVARAA